MTELRDRISHYSRRARGVTEAVFVDEANIKKPLKILLGKGHFKHERAIAGLCLVSRLIPDSVRASVKRRYRYSQDKMPLDSEGYTLNERKIGSGGVNDVFVLTARETKHPSYVIKVNRASRGTQNTRELVQIAKKQKAEYEEIASVYESIDGLVPQEHHFIIHDPRAGKPVSVILQAFLGKDIRDVFEDIPKDEFVHLLKGNDILARQLADFVTITESDPTLIDNELDLLGKDNLAVVGDPGEERLIFLDPHFTTIESRSPERKKIIKKKLNYLKRMSESLQH